MGESFNKAVALIAKAPGRVIITGIGKSGHVGQKVAATLASTGTPAFFVHPTEASHGDLGMITPEDVIIGFSWSGETTELTNIINFASRFKVALIAITSKRDSTLGHNSTLCLTLPKAEEACPHGLAPTTSTIMQLAIGDCLAIALLEYKGFSASDFKVFHPGGQLGANLKYVQDLMHEGDQLPLIDIDILMKDALLTMTEKSFGCVGIINSDQQLVGVITDGDLRRNMSDDFLTKTAQEIMKTDPITIPPQMLASSALELLNSSGITSLFVVEDNKPIGLLHVHDLLRAGIL